MSPAVADGALASELIEHCRARLTKWSCARRSEPERDFCAPWLSAYEARERQYGMFWLTSPASSMTRVWKSSSRAFHVR
jgi:hypothetical protein